VKPRLLIVDDESDMLDFLERVFRADYDITRAAGAGEALEALGHGDYQVLITDHKMPKVSGIELVELLHDKHPQMVRVLISGFTDVPEVQKLIQGARIDNYVVKPVDSQHLRAVVQEAVDHKRV